MESAKRRRTRNGGEASNPPPSQKETEGGEIGVTIDANLLDCSICFHHLSPPVKQCKNGHTACSSCWSKLQYKCHLCTLCVQSCNIALDKILEATQVPCTYVSLGCCKSVSYLHKQMHTDTCEFGPSLCPIPRCAHKAISGEWQEHFLKEHGNTDTCTNYDYDQPVKIIFNENYLYYTFVGPGKDLFLLVKKPIVNVGYALSLYCIDMPHQDHNVFSYDIVVYDSMSIVQFFNSPVISIKEWKKGEVDCSPLLVPFGFPGSQNRMVHVEIKNEELNKEAEGETSNPPPPPPQKVIWGGESSNPPLPPPQKEIRGGETMNPSSPREMGGGDTSNPPTGGRKEMTNTIDPDLLDCSICSHPLCPPIYQCINGHVACLSCWRKVQHNCYICNVPALIPNIALEKVLEAIHVPCTYACLGCRKFVSYSQRRGHADTCDFSPSLCPIPRCAHKASSGEWREHFLKEHWNTGTHTHYDYDRSVQIIFNEMDLYYTFVGPGKDLFLLVKEPIVNFGYSLSLYYIDLPHQDLDVFSYVIKMYGCNRRLMGLVSKVVSIKEWKRGKVPDRSLLVPFGYTELPVKVVVEINKELDVTLSD